MRSTARIEDDERNSHWSESFKTDAKCERTKGEEEMTTCKCSTLKMLYAAPIWVHGLEKKYTGDMLTKAQRYVSLRIISGYRTVSTSAVLAVVSLSPTDLLAVERKEIYASTKNRERMSARNQEVPH